MIITKLLYSKCCTEITVILGRTEAVSKRNWVGKGREKLVHSIGLNISVSYGS